MRILIASAALDTDGSATGILIGNLIEVFRAQQHEVECLTRKRSFYDHDLSFFKDVPVHHANFVSVFRKGKKRIADFTFAAIRKITLHQKRAARSLYDSWQVKAFVSKLRSMRANQYDAIIAFCANHDIMEAILRYKKKHITKTKVVLVQFDPLTENFSYKNRDAYALSAYEKRIYNECDFVFSAPFILQKKGQEWFHNHVFESELPSIVEKDVSEPLSHDCINCVYAGDLYKGIRDPRFVLDLFSRFKSSKIKLIILSDGEKALLQKYADTELKGRLFNMGRVGERECNRYLDEADIFINIGNKIDNQLPSKVLNYMCYGKMILNFPAIFNCPTLSYLEKYPLATNVPSYLPLSDDQVAEIEETLVANYKKRLSFETIKKQFYKCTPEYVAESLLSVLKQ